MECGMLQLRLQDLSGGAERRGSSSLHMLPATAAWRGSLWAWGSIFLKPFSADIHCYHHALLCRYEDFFGPRRDVRGAARAAAAAGSKRRRPAAEADGLGSEDEEGEQQEGMNGLMGSDEEDEEDAGPGGHFLL